MPETRRTPTSRAVNGRLAAWFAVVSVGGASTLAPGGWAVQDGVGFETPVSTPEADASAVVIDPQVLASIPATFDGLGAALVAEERRAMARHARADHLDAIERRLDEVLPMPTSDAPADGVLATALQRRGDVLHRLLVVASSVELAYETEAVSRRDRLADAATATFGRMRVDWLGRPLGALGAIGEARVLAARGEGQAALDRLESIVGEDLDPRLRPVANAVRLEALLVADPVAAMAEAQAATPPNEVMVARAADQLGRPDEAATAARRAGDAMDHVARLSMLVRLDRATPDERAAWAETLIAFGFESSALDFMDADPDRSMRTAELHANLLERAGRPADAAAVHATRLAATPTDDARRDVARALTAVVAGLPAAADAAVRDAATNRARDAAAAYLDAANVDRSDYAEVLGWWISMADDEAVRVRLAALPPAFRDSPAVAYRHAAARRETADPDQLAGELIEVARRAREAGQSGVEAAAILLRAQLEPRARDGLRLLDAHQGLLDADAVTRGPARHFRTELRLRLGMLDAAAADLVAAIDAERVPGRRLDERDPRLTPETLLAVAEGLADRYVDGFRDGIRPLATRLATESIDRPSRGDAVASDAIAIRAARVLGRLEAWSDAERVLATISPSAAGRVGAEIAWRRGRIDDALSALEADVSPAGTALKSRILLSADRAPEAIEIARRVRSTTPAGGEIWWDATLLVVEAQVRMGEPAAGAAILRAAEALHPTGSRRGLAARIERLRQELLP